MNTRFFYCLTVLLITVANVQAWCELFDGLTITPKIGVAPTVFTKRDCNYLVLPAAFQLGVNPVISIGQMPKFNSLFKVPVYVGGEISWCLCENVESYLELVYRHGKGRCVQIPAVILGDAVTLSADLDAFKALGFYGGVRTGWQSWCGYFNWFVGAKVGLVHHWEIDAHIAANQIPIQSTIAFFKNNVVSGGALLGIEKCFTDCFSLSLVGEVVATGGLRNNRNVIIADPGSLGLGVTNLNYGAIGTEVSFPVYVGFNISF